MLYCSNWLIPTAVGMFFFLCWFFDKYLAYGFGWGNWCLLAWLVNEIAYFVAMKKTTKRRKRMFVGAFFACLILQFGGCYSYERSVPALPENTECKFEKYDRIKLGAYSDCVPAGAWNITFSYYSGLFSGRHVKCNVSERDFLWFCWRNGYRVRKGVLPVNEYTGEVLKTEWFGYDRNRVSDYYSYFDVNENARWR